MRIRYHAGATVLDSGEEVVRTTLDDAPLVGRTEVRGAGGDLRAVMEYPIKTMNVQRERARFQVDTGPIIWADLERSEDPTLRRCPVSHICYNSWDSAEVIARESIPVLHEGQASSLVDF